MSVPAASPAVVSVLLETQELNRRISARALGNYIAQIQRVTEQYFQDARLHRGLEIVIGLILIPDAAPCFDLQVQPWVDEPTAEGLAVRLRDVESPPVWEGPIFAQIQITIGNGCQWVGKKFVLPFSTKIGHSAEGETSDRYVQRYLEFEAKRRRRIDTVLKDACRGLAERYLPSALVNLVPKTWKRSPVAVRKPVVLPPLPETPAEGMTVPMRQRIPEDQLDELIELQPE